MGCLNRSGVLLAAKDKNLPKNAQARIRAYFMHRFKNKIYFNEQDMMAELPPSMSNQVAEHMYGSIMRNCPLFRGLGTPVINKICRLVIPSTCVKLDSLRASDIYMRA